MAVLEGLKSMTPGDSRRWAQLAVVKLGPQVERLQYERASLQARVSEAHRRRDVGTFNLLAPRLRAVHNE
jgi:hypothetical protein